MTRCFSVYIMPPNPPGRVLTLQSPGLHPESSPPPGACIVTGVPGPRREVCAGVLEGPHFEKRCPQNPLTSPCHHPSRCTSFHSAVRSAVCLSPLRACARGMLASHRPGGTRCCTCRLSGMGQGGRAEWRPLGPVLQEDIEQSLRHPCSLS